MKVGTKSVLFGVHCFFIHPIFVAKAWIKIYGFPFDLRIWLAFIVHDLGYWGKPNMDGAEGEDHVLLGAKIMSIFGKKWHDFCLYHSRFYSKKMGAQYSKLCVADKYSFVVTPRWLYILTASWSGEIYEYMSIAKKYTDSNFNAYINELSYTDKLSWHKSVKQYLSDWTDQHKDIKEDTWTKTERTEVGENGVY